jgi:hypothetical protein
VDIKGFFSGKYGSMREVAHECERSMVHGSHASRWGAFRGR